MTGVGASHRQKERTHSGRYPILDRWNRKATADVGWVLSYRHRNGHEPIISKWDRRDNSRARTLDVDLYEYCLTCYQHLVIHEVKGENEEEFYWTMTRRTAQKLGAWGALTVEMSDGTVEMEFYNPEGNHIKREKFSESQWLKFLKERVSEHEREAGHR